jgi:restriction endonuclease S subunit
MLTYIQDGLHGVRRYVPEGVPLLGVGNVTEGGIDLTEVNRITELEHGRLARSRVRRGDLLVTITGRIGTAAIYDSDEPANLSAHVALCRAENEDTLLFLKHYLASRFGAASLTKAQIGSTHPHINVRRLAELPIPLPPTEVQQELVQMMETAREARKQKLREADELLAGLDAYLLETLGLTLPSVKLRTIFAVRLPEINRCRFDTFFHRPDLKKTEELVREYKPMNTLRSLLSRPPMNGVDARTFVDAGQKYLRVQNIRPYELALDDVKRVVTGFSKDIFLKAGDILLTRKGTFGVAALVPADAEDYVISSEIILLRLRTDCDCLPEYLIAWLNNSLAKTVFDRHKAGGIMGHLTQEVVSDFPVPLPEPKVQEAIAAEVHRRREQARRLRGEADADWAAAKRRLEEQLLNPDSHLIGAKNKSASARLTQ